MSCGRYEDPTEIKLEEKRQARTSGVELEQIISASTTSSLWLEMQNPLLLDT